MAQVSAKRDLLSPWFLFLGKAECMSELLASPDMGNTAKETHFFPLLTEHWIMNCMTIGWWAAGRTEVRAQKGKYQSDTYLKNCFRPHQKVHPWSARNTLPMETDPGPPLMLCMPHPYTHPTPHGCLSVYAPEDSENKPLQMASEHVQEAVPTLQVFREST